MAATFGLVQKAWNGQGSQTSSRIVTGLKVASDWILLGVLELGAHLLGEKLPHYQLFSILDPSISFPYIADRSKVSNTQLFLLCAALPLIVIIVVSGLLTRGPIKRRAWVCNYDILGLGLSIIAVQFVTELIKFVAGRPRPDTISRCQPDLVRAEAAFTTTAVALFDISICTQTDSKILNDAFRSFPSGHASMSFGGLTYLTLYLSARMSLFVPFSRHGRHLYSFIIAFAPVVVAAWVAITRISDFRHRLSDIAVGSLLGIIGGLLAYRFYHPWVTSIHSGIPWGVLREEKSDVASESVEVLPTVFPKNVATPYSDDSKIGFNGLTPNGQLLDPSAMELRPVPQITISSSSGLAGRRSQEASGGV